MEVHAFADHERLYNEVVHEFYYEVQDNDIQYGIKTTVLHQRDE